jgi:hypothetical protein
MKVVLPFHNIKCIFYSFNSYSKLVVAQSLKKKQNDQKCSSQRTAIGSKEVPDSRCPEGVRCSGGEIKESVSFMRGKKLVTNEDLVISEKNDLYKEWFMKYHQST